MVVVGVLACSAPLLAVACEAASTFIERPIASALAKAVAAMRCMVSSPYFDDLNRAIDTLSELLEGYTFSLFSALMTSRPRVASSVTRRSNAIPAATAAE